MARDMDDFLYHFGNSQMSYTRSVPKRFSNFQHDCGNETGKRCGVAILCTINAGLSGLHIGGCDCVIKFDAEMKRVREVCLREVQEFV